MTGEDKLSEPWTFFSKPSTTHTESEAGDYNRGRQLWGKKAVPRLQTNIKFQNGIVMGKESKVESS